MFYIPNYCCNCGEKIERPNPAFNDSRKFCDVCKHDFVLHRVWPIIFIAFMAFLGIFGIGSYWRSGEKPLNVSTKQFAANLSNSGKTAANQSLQVNANSSVQPLAQTNNGRTNMQNAPQTRNLTTKTQVRQSESAPLSAGEITYYCGAMTKKGTPCSRRVKGGGRCWQHKGQDAMLPPEKLLASQ
jgi:hypothetical protein